MADFTSQELETFRRRWIRDFVDADEEISDYNRANHRPYITDADINAIKAEVELDREEELRALYNAHFTQFRNAGDDSTTADSKAMTARLHALYRLVRAEIYSLMLVDPGYQSSIAESRNRTEFYNNLRSAIAIDRAYVRNRTGPYSSVEIIFA